MLPSTPRVSALHAFTPLPSREPAEESALLSLHAGLLLLSPVANTDLLTGHAWEAGGVSRSGVEARQAQLLTAG